MPDSVQAPLRMDKHAHTPSQAVPAPWGRHQGPCTRQGGSTDFTETRCLRLLASLWVLLVRSSNHVWVVPSGVLAAVPPLGNSLRALGDLC